MPEKSVVAEADRAYVHEESLVAEADRAYGLEHCDPAALARYLTGLLDRPKPSSCKSDSDCIALAVNGVQVVAVNNSEIVDAMNDRRLFLARVEYSNSCPLGLNIAEAPALCELSKQGLGVCKPAPERPLSPQEQEERALDSALKSCDFGVLGRSLDLRYDKHRDPCSESSECTALALREDAKGKIETSAFFALASKANASEITQDPVLVERLRRFEQKCGTQLQVVELLDGSCGAECEDCPPRCGPPPLKPFICRPQYMHLDEQ